MSLINDALRKAQRERAGQPGAQPTPPPAAGEPPSSTPPPPAPVYRPAPSRGGPGIGLFAGIAVALVIGGGAVWWIMRPSSAGTGMSPANPTVANTAPTTTAPATVAPPAASAPAPVSSASNPLPASSTPATTASAPAPAVPAPAPLDIRINVPPIGAPPPAATTPPPSSATPSVATSVPTPATTTPPVATNPTVPAPNLHPAMNPAAAVSGGTEDPRILAFLDSAQIGGIRASLDDPRLLMNNRVFRQGDMVDRPLKLRLSKIEPGKLTFTDERGTVYLKEI